MLQNKGSSQTDSFDPQTHKYNFVDTCSVQLQLYSFKSQSIYNMSFLSFYQLSRAKKVKPWPK